MGVYIQHACLYSADYLLDLFIQYFLINDLKPDLDLFWTCVCFGVQAVKVFLRPSCIHFDCYHDITVAQRSNSETNIHGSQRISPVVSGDS